MTVLAKARPRQIEKDLSSYALLRERVRETLMEGQQKIERQKVLTYWQTGKYILEHLLLNQKRAELGAQVVQNLAQDLEVEKSRLWTMLRFARCFPVVNARSQLLWAHYRAVLSVKDPVEREKLLDRAEREGWNSRELELRARRSGQRKAGPVTLTAVRTGPFHTYQIVRPETVHGDRRTLLLDLGFSMKKELNLFAGAKFREGMIVASVRDSSGRYSLREVQAPGTPEEWLYTYKAYVVKVMDGDTLKVDFRLGFGDRRGETIRLKGIDCPELDAPGGRAAQRFVEAQLAGCEFITVKSIRTRKEKWGCYLGDVFFTPQGNSQPVYLNQLLLDKRYAVLLRRDAPAVTA